MTHHENSHEHEQDEDSYGMAFGFRIFEHDGGLFLAEAEITPYVDDPDALGATLVFHPLEGINPVAGDAEVEWPAWPVDIDDELTREAGEPIPAQFQSILRQLGTFSEAELRQYLDLAREEAEEEAE